MHGRFSADLYVALPFGDEVEYHHPLGIRFKQRRSRVSARRLVAPGRREARIDEDGADQANDSKGFRERVHHPPATSMHKVIGTASRAAADTGEQRLHSSIRLRNRSGATPGAAIRTSS